MKILPKNEHWYESPTNPGTYYPSVTKVTAYLPKGKFFEEYLANQESYEEANKILKEAGERGTRVHEATELLDRGHTITYPYLRLEDDEYQLVSYYVDWHKKYQPEVLDVELRLISDKHKLGGTADRIYKIDGKMTLFDLKTSRSAIYDSHWIQVAAYADMYEHLKGTKIDQVCILRLTPRRKEGYEYVVRNRVAWQKDLKQFKKTYDTMIYLLDGKVPKPKFIELPDVLTLN
jgi:CRISPR/Cas system-associated exonuclease Cas4 (RecB family)